MDSVTSDAPTPRRTKPKGRHPHNRLAAAFIRSAPVGRHADGNGLYLYVQRTGTRSWIQRLVIRGRKHELGLGSVHLVSLAEAREQALANRKLARAGGDPLADKRRGQGMPTFTEAATTVVEQKRAGWRSSRQAADWLHSLERYAFPRIGSRSVSEINSADVLAILTPIWHTQAPTAKALRQRIAAVLEWSVAMEYRSDNPCDRIGPVLGPQRNLVQHRRALPHRDVAAAIETVRVSKAARAVTLAFEFLVLTAARSGEVRLATWDEMDESGRVWTIPAPRMKMHRGHRVPLSGRALEVLDAARSLGDGDGLVFPNRLGNRIKDTFLSDLLRNLGIAAVPHGFRSSFRDWASEETDHPREVVEAALAHVVGNKVEAAYARSDLFERRRLLMDDWANTLPAHTLSLPRAWSQWITNSPEPQHPEPAPILPPVDHTDAQDGSGGNGSTDGHQRAGERGTASSGTAITRRSLRATTRRRAGDEETNGREIGAQRTLAHDTDRSHEPAYPMCYMGLTRGFAPSTPGRSYGATSRPLGPAVEAAVAGSVGGRSISAGTFPVSEAHGRPPPSTRWRGSVACASALWVTAATDRAGLLLRASRKGWPANHDERNAACRGSANQPRSRRCHARPRATRR